MDNCVRVAQQLAVVANAIAVAISENLTIDEQNVLGNLICLVGTSLLSIAATAETCSNLKSSDDTKNSKDSSSDNSTQNDKSATSNNSTQNAESPPSDNSEQKGKTSSPNNVPTSEIFI